MNNKKLTNVLALEMVLTMEEVKSNQELVEKLTKMKEQFEKKNNSGTGSKKLTKTQIENEEIKAQILEVMTSEPKAIKELQAENESLAEYTNQKLSALLKQLVGENKVERIEEKRVAKFKKVVDNQ